MRMSDLFQNNNVNAVTILCLMKYRATWFQLNLQPKVLIIMDKHIKTVINVCLLIFDLR